MTGGFALPSQTPWLGRKKEEEVDEDNEAGQERPVVGSIKTHQTKTEWALQGERPRGQVELWQHSTWPLLSLSAMLQPPHSLCQ